MMRAITLALIVTLGGLSIAVAAFQAPPRPAEALAATKIEKVKDNLYVITGSTPAPRETFSGGNTGVFITDAGVVVVDTKLAGWGQAILDRIKTVTDKPVTTIINTHTHGDHTGSNEFFGANVEIVVQENTKANMEKMDAFKGDKAKFLPKKTYKDKMTLGAGKDRIDLYYFGPGHTNGDTFVVFRALRMMHAGDMFPWKDAPFIDRSNGGSGVEWPQTSSTRCWRTSRTSTPSSAGISRWRHGRICRRFSSSLPTCWRRRKRRMKAGKSGGRCGRGHGMDQQVSRLRDHAREGGRSGDLRRAERQVTR